MWNEAWYRGQGGDSLWSGQKAGTGFQGGKRQGDQVKTRNAGHHYTFPTLSSSLSSPFQFRNFNLGWYPSSACCYGPLAKISLGEGMKSNQAVVRLEMKLQDLNIIRGRGDAPQKLIAVALCKCSVIPPKGKVNSLYLLSSKSSVSERSQTAVLTGSHRDSKKLIIRFDSHVIIVNNGIGDVPTTSHSCCFSGWEELLYDCKSANHIWHRDISCKK